MLSQSARLVCVRNASSLGFIGLGNMGGPMALNLLNKAKGDLWVYDVNAESVDKAVKAGAKAASAPAEIAENCDRIVTMLPNSPHVMSTFGGDQGLLSAAKAGTLFLDCSTIDPAAAQTVAKMCLEKETVFMDAPVSGGVGAAAAGTLTFMVGGPAAEFEAGQSILQHMGAKIVACGEVGTGQAAKICNNMMLGISMIGVSETYNLGKRLGLDPKILASIVNAASGRCWASDTYNPVPGVIEGVPSSNGYAGGFGTTLMAKDLGLAQDAATNTQTPIPLGSLAHQIYRVMSSDPRFADKDFSSVYAMLSEEKLI